MSSPSVGAHLRRLREGRGMSLEEIARATRVSSSYLHALETDDFASLPVPVFTRGFIRAYCQTLGEAPEPVLALYDARTDPAPAMAEAAPAPASRAPSSRMPAPPEAAPKNRGPLLVSFVLLIVLGIALFAVTLVLQSGRERGAGRMAAAPSPPSTGASTPATPAAGASAPSASAPGGTAAGASTPAVAAPATATPQTPRPEAPAASSPPAAGPPTAPPSTGASVPASAGGRHRLIARTTEPTWMRVRTEDGRVSEETIPAGQVREWHSTGPFRVTVGNAGGVTLEVDGRTLPPLGARGAVVPDLVVPTERQ